MRRFTFSRQPELTDLVFQFEMYAGTGVFPGFGEAEFIQVYNHYRHSQFFVEAMDALDAALAVYPRSSRLHAYKAIHLIDSQKEELALDMLDEAEMCGHCMVATDLLRVKALSGQKQFQQALLLIDSIKKSDRLSEAQINEVLLCEADTASRSEDYGRAFEALEKVLLAQPGHVGALQKMYNLIEVSRDFDTSLAFHLNLTNEDPYSYMAWFNLGHAYYGKFEYEKAIAAFEYSFLIQPDFVLGYLDCAEVCQQVKRYRQALICYRDVLEHLSPNASLLQAIGECYEGLDKLEDAKRFYFRSLTFHAKNEEVFFRIGQCYLKEYNLKMAGRFFQKAWNFDKKREDFVEALATTLFRLGRHSKVSPLMENVIELNPGEDHGWILYAKFLTLTGRFEEALELLDRAEENTYSERIYFCRAAALYLLNQKFDAFDQLSMALEEDSSGMELFFELVPHVRNDKKMRDLLRYYNLEYELV